ncbi:hypothetical protein D3C84_900690 [compost metagenome]
MFIGFVEVAGDAVPARCTCQRTADTANTVGWVVDGSHQFPRLIRAFDHRYQQRLHADIEHLFDQCCIANDRSNDRMARVGRHGLKLAKHPAQIVGRMFAVDQQPVESGVGGQFGAVGVGQSQPQADLRFTALQAKLEGVDGHLHRTLLD